MKAVLLMGVAVGIFAHLFAAPRTEVISAQMRDSDPTVMDVKYRVSSSSDKVNVRVLAFEDGVRSFANVVRPTTFLEGSVIGDNVPANTVNSFAWKVSADWKVDLAKVSVEVLAQDVEFLSPREQTAAGGPASDPGPGYTEVVDEELPFN